MSRFSNDPSEALRDARSAGYVAARVAQGVPVLDRDLNLLGELAAQAVREALCRYTGDGLVSTDTAFRVAVTSDSTGFELQGPGWAVVGGMEVSIERSTRIETFIHSNPESESPIEDTPRDLVCWLDVWLVEVDEQGDAALANSRDVGVLTSSRWKPTWTWCWTGPQMTPSPNPGHHYLPLARVVRVGTNRPTLEDLRPVGLTLGRKSPTRKSLDGAIGRLTVVDSTGAPRLRLDGAAGALTLSQGASALKVNAAGLSIGDLGLGIFAENDTKPLLTVTPDASLTLGNGHGGATLCLRNKDQDTAILLHGGGVSPIAVRNNAGASLLTLSSTAKLVLGSEGAAGSLSVVDSAGHECLQTDTVGSVRFQISSYDDKAKPNTSTTLFQVRTTGDVVVGGNGTRGKITVMGEATDEPGMVFDGATGVGTSLKGFLVKDSKGLDLAEKFAVANAAEAPPGTVMVSCGGEVLRPSSSAYDPRVVGVVSGAGPYSPGFLLNAGDPDTAAVALAGRVYCKVDASFGAIAEGDLLTSSPRSGHAMKASDRERAFGTVLGKALAPLSEGQSLIPILVTLQ